MPKVRRVHVRRVQVWCVQVRRVQVWQVDVRQVALLGRLVLRTRGTNTRGSRLLLLLVADVWHVQVWRVKVRQVHVRQMESPMGRWSEARLYGPFQGLGTPLPRDRSPLGHNWRRCGTSPAHPPARAFRRCAAATLHPRARLVRRGLRTVAAPCTPGLGRSVAGGSAAARRPLRDQRVELGGPPIAQALLDGAEALTHLFAFGFASGVDG